LGVENIQYKALGAYELFTQDNETSFEECATKINYLNKMIKEITGESQTYSIRDAFIIYNQSEGQIDTGAMMKTLIQKAQDLDIEILNGINITDIKEEAGFVELQTAKKWTIKANKVLVATNGFTQQLLPNINLTRANRHFWNY